MTIDFKILLVLQIVLNCKLIILSAVWVSMAWIPGCFRLWENFPKMQFLVCHA